MCDKNCFDCPYEDCVNDEFTAEDLRELYEAEILAGIITPKQIAAKEEYEKNRDKWAAIRKRYYAKNREELNRRHREYYQAHKEEYKAKQREYHARNKERLNANKREARKRRLAEARSDS